MIDYTDIKDVKRLISDNKNLYFYDCNFTGISFMPFDLKGAKFVNSNLRYTKFASKNCKNLVFENVQFSYSDLHQVNLKKAYIVNSDMKCTDLSYGFLEETEFYDTNLSHADLKFSYCFNTKFSCSILIAVDFTSANLTGADLAHVDLTGANLNGANLTGANLTGANMTCVNLNGADLTDANMTGANLTGANLTGANLDDANTEKVVNFGYTAVSDQTLNIYKVRNNIFVPRYGTKDSACFDIYSSIEPGNDIEYYSYNNRKKMYSVKSDGIFPLDAGCRALIPSGIIFDLNANQSIRLHPRSGISLKNGIMLANCEGIIDSDYIEECFIPLYNASNVTFFIKNGMRLVQAEIVNNTRVRFNIVSKPPKLKGNRKGGLGSTGLTEKLQ